MPELALSRAQAAEEAENAGANDSSNPTMGDIIAARFSRRDLLRGRPRRHGDFNTTPSFTFKEVTARADDRHDIADGYDADLQIRWGDAVLARTGRNDGLWALETEGEARGTSKHFFRCPNGAELCGLTSPGR